VAEDAVGVANQPDGSVAANARLDSWKEIAAYLKRDVTTVRRWEKREGLPVHRHQHERRDSGYAYIAEVDAWWQDRSNHLAQNGAVDTAPRGMPDHEPQGLPPVAESARRLQSDRRAALARVLALTFFVTTLALAAFIVFLYLRTTPQNDREFRLSVLPPEETSFGTVSLSPDGRQLAFTAAPRSGSGGTTLLWVRPVDDAAARSLPDTENAAFPFWSPASDALGFFANGKLWTIAIDGGSPRAVCDAPHARGGTWNGDGIIVFAPDREGALFRVAATGGATAPVTTVARPNERGHVWPEFLPDGNHFLYLADSNVPEHHRVFVGALNGQGRKAVVDLASSNAAYGANGYLFFARERQLLAQPFDAIHLTGTGEAVTVIDRVHQPLGMDHKMDFSVSASGPLVYRTMQSPATRLVWRDRAQRLSALVGTPAEYYEPVLSPDEARVAVGLFDPRPSKRFGYGVVGVRSDIWVVDRATGAASQFTSDPAADWGPVWSPDGRRMVFSSNRRGTLELYQKETASADAPEELLLPAKGTNPVAQSWSRDGSFLLYSAFDPKTHMDLWLLRMLEARTSVPLLHSEFNEEQGQISPDGRWFSYTSNESGRAEVWVQSFPPANVKWQISSSGGGDARWRPDGKELFYIGDDRRLMAVPVKTSATFEHGPAVPLFDTGVPPHWYEARNLYDVSRDGRLLFMTPVEDDRSSPFTIVLNWAAGQRR